MLFRNPIMKSFLTLLSAAVLSTSLLAQAPAAPDQYPSEEELESLTPGAWTLAVIPDTQYYVDHTRRIPPTPDTFQSMIDWLVANQAARNIGLVLHVGDIVDNNTDEEWAMARSILEKLDGELPYVLATGNHEYTGNADVRETDLNQWFTAADNPLNDPGQGGILGDWMEPGRLENALYQWTAPDGRPFAILSLEWGTRDRALAWARQALSSPRFRDHTGILVTHAYLYHDDTLYDWEAKGSTQAANPFAYQMAETGTTNDGRMIWNQLVSQHSQFELVFCGHVSGYDEERYYLGDDAEIGYLASKADTGQTVHQMLFDAQRRGDAGDGWLRLLEFQPDGQTVIVKTYSPWLDERGLDPWRSDPQNYFRIQLRPFATN